MNCSHIFIYTREEAAQRDGQQTAVRGLREVVSTQALVSAQLVDQVLQECPVNQKCLYQQAALVVCWRSQSSRGTPSQP